jgi:hypothetical protein
VFRPPPVFWLAMRVKDWNLGGPVEPGLLRFEEDGPLADGRWGDEWNAPLIVVAGGEEMDRGKGRR